MSTPPTDELPKPPSGLPASLGTLLLAAATAGLSMWLGDEEKLHLSRESVLALASGTAVVIAGMGFYIRKLREAWSLRQDRKDRIRRWREGFEQAWVSGDPNEDQKFFDSWLWADLKAHLPKERVSSLMNRDTMTIVLDHGLVSRKSKFLDAIGSLEKQWGLIG